MLDKIKNKKEEILNKKFKKNFKVGYDPYEVDNFFDSTITYLTYLENELISVDNLNKNLKSHISKLTQSNDKKRNKINVLENELNELKDDGYQQQKIIKDISSLKDSYAKIENKNK